MPNLPWAERTVAQLTLIGTSFANRVINVHHFQAGTASESGFSTDALAIAWADALAADWVTSLKAAWVGIHTPSYKLDLVKVQVIERPGNFRHKLVPTELPQTSGNVGTQAQDALNNVDAAVMKWKTTSAGKSTRGRTYIGPLTSQAVTAGQITSAMQTVYSTYGTAMVARYAVGGTQYNTYALTIYSRPYNEGEYQYASRKTGTLAVVTPPDYAGNATNVSAFQLDPVVRTQRRRQIGVGT